MKKKDPLRDEKYELLRILKEHDVPGMRMFIENNPKYFSAMGDEERDDDYLFDLIHVYKAHLLYMGNQHFESVKYCVEKGLIKLSAEMTEYYEKAEKNKKEILECVSIPELDQDLPLQ